MERHLSLLESRDQQIEKRVLPRFPFSYLTFRSAHNAERVFEVKDITFSGMQIALKDGSHQLKKGGPIEGAIHWVGDQISIQGVVQWTTAKRAGIQFDEKLNGVLQKFLSVGQLAQGMKALHQRKDENLELPAQLKYWLRNDGPVEIFVWQYANGDISHFQFIILDNFLEWKNGPGLKTGRVMTKRDLETPLIQEDEFIFRIDSEISVERIQLARQLIELLPEGALGQDASEFLLLKCHF